MKEVLYHFVKMVKVEVPDECPTNNFESMDTWLLDHQVEPVILKKDARDFEIVVVVKKCDECNREGMYQTREGFLCDICINKGLS